MHILKSLKSTGKAAVILPHGVLFRGNAEATIRRAIIDKGFIKGIIGLPANLFYGTGIPACILVIDKEDADVRAGSLADYQDMDTDAMQKRLAEEAERGKGIFMIDASRGFIKAATRTACGRRTFTGSSPPSTASLKTIPSMPALFQTVRSRSGTTIT